MRRVCQNRHVSNETQQLYAVARAGRHPLPAPPSLYCETPWRAELDAQSLGGPRCELSEAGSRRATHASAARHAPRQQRARGLEPPPLRAPTGQPGGKGGVSQGEPPPPQNFEFSFHVPLLWVQCLMDRPALWDAENVRFHPAAGEWVACSERLPEPGGGMLLIVDTEDNVQSAHWDGDERWYVGNGMYAHAAYWAPLYFPGTT